MFLLDKPQEGKCRESKCQAAIEGEGKELVRFGDISKAFLRSLVQDINIANYDTVRNFFSNFQFLTVMK